MHVYDYICQRASVNFSSFFNISDLFEVYFYNLYYKIICNIILKTVELLLYVLLKHIN